MEYDVFFSYPHKDASEVMQIFEALQNLGLSVWIDECEICDFESITKSIVEGLAQSKVLLAYYSLNYWRSCACQWELTAAFLAAQSEGDPRRRVLIVNPEEKADHIHPVELRDELFLTEFKDAESLEHLASSVKKQIQGIKNVIGDVHALNKPQWYGKKGVGSNRFVGRLPDMWKIHSALHASELPVITGSNASSVVQVQGMGGVGKSLLAVEYALRYAAAFPCGVFWLRAFGSDDIKAALKPEELEAERIRQIVDIAISYGIPVKNQSSEEIEAHLASELGLNGKPFLWIVDDVPPGMDLDALQRWFASHPQGKTLITTRSKEYSSLGKLVPLGVLEPEDAWDLLTLWRKPETEDEEGAARMLIADLGYHALALDVAGAALHASEGFQSFSEFREELADPTSDELELAAELIGMLPTGHEKSIASTLFRSIERLGAEGRDFLRLASMLAVAPIPPSLVSAVFSDVDDIDEPSGKRRAQIALFQADTLSLTERAEDKAGARSVHVLISRTVRFKDSLLERSEMLHVAAVRALITKLSIIAEDQVNNELRLNITHARELARHDSLQGAYKSAETLLRREMDIRTLFHGNEQPDFAALLNNLATLYRHMGAYDKALPLYQRALDILEKVHGPKHPDVAALLNNLADLYDSMGDYDKALPIYGSALDILEKVHGPEHPYVATTLNNLAELYRHMGDYDKAIPLNHRALDILEKVHGPEHQDVATTLNNLSAVYGSMEAYDKALQHSLRALEILEKVHGPEHPDVATTLNNLAELYRQKGNYGEALQHSLRALDIREKVHDPNHPDVAITLNNLAAVYDGMGAYEEALPLYKRALKIFEKVLGPEHPNVAIAQNNLAAVYRQLGVYNKALHFMRECLKFLKRLWVQHIEIL